MTDRRMSADHKAFQERLSDYSQEWEFIAWLEREGHDRNKVTSQMLDEFVELKIEKFLKRPADSSILDIEEVDPARIDPEVWNAGVEEYCREGHDAGSIPVERQKFEALLHSRRARLAAEQYERAKEAQRRERTINSLLRPPKPSDVALDGKSVCDAQNAYNKGREEFSDAWNSKYQELPDAVSTAWDLYHDAEGDSEMRLRDRTPTVHDLPDDLTEIENGLADPEYQKFERYSAAILQQLERLAADLENAINPPPGSRPLLKGRSLNEIDENVGSVWPVPRLIPHGLTFVYGLPKGGKSLWMQKLSACIAGGVPFDGIEELEHGRVLYITRDIGASRQEVKKRFMKILQRLGLSEDALEGKLMLTDDLFHLNDPASVDNLLAHNPDRFVLVVIDSLFRCVSGSLSQDVVASAAMDAIERISRATGAAVAVIHHEPRSSEHLFGSVMLDAAYDAKIHVERGKDRNSVIVTVQELKNAPVPDKPFTYRIEEEYMAAVTGAASATTPKPASSRHQEMLALLPAGWFTRKEGRKLVEPLLTGAEEARRKQWQRAVAAMKASGEIEVRTTRMRKT